MHCYYNTICLVPSSLTLNLHLYHDNISSKIHILNVKNVQNQERFDKDDTLFV